MSGNEAPEDRNWRTQRLEADVAGLSKKMDEFAKSLVDGLGRLDTSFRQGMEGLGDKFVPRRELDERFSNIAQDTVRFSQEVNRRIESLEEGNKWAMRLVVAAVVTAVAAVLVALVRIGLHV